MSVAAAIEVKGWCPGVLRPMQSGDGLIARVRPWAGAFGLAEASALADASEVFGNGHIDLTRRANLQIRGLGETSLSGLQDIVERHRLVDRSADAEAVRNIMVSPLAGLDPSERIDVRRLARALESGLAADTALHSLPSKFGFLVDGGGSVSISGERADVALRVVGQAVAVGLDTRSGAEWIGRTSPDAAAKTALMAARVFLGVRREQRRLRDLGDEGLAHVRSVLAPLLGPLDGDLPVDRDRPLGMIPLGAGRTAVGIAAAFGRLEAHQLRSLLAVVEDAGATDIRPSPWRSLYVGARDIAAAHRVVEAARDIGLIVEANDPILRIDACPGAPDCRSSSVDARRDARRFAALGFAGTLHVSGCAKGCARSTPADLVLVGEQGHYQVVRQGTTRDAPERTVAVEEAGTLFHV
ncbi:precorrin-3B synthase [Reyranella sp.]|uniref:precorrin-3B synthase n=1 Tax=Reyranella sp. TaxID=1929291 RepID=UPI0025F3EA38|nr:precorrin-3B synthase [Reyranella sp.]